MVKSTGSDGQIATSTTFIPIVTPNSPSGLSQADKIALGSGIGVGLPGTIAGVVLCVRQLLKKPKTCAQVYGMQRFH